MSSATASATPPSSPPKAGGTGGVQLSVAWQWKAALLSRPVDLTALVALSRSHAHEFITEGIPHKMVAKLLNNASEAISSRDTKVDALIILGNLAACSGQEGKLVVRDCLGGVTHFFEEYLWEQESGRAAACHGGGMGGGEHHDMCEEPPDLHKAMLLLLSRVYDYNLKTEDVLELTRDDRMLALECVLGILEEGETYSLELKQRARPREGRLGQWEHEYVTHRHEKPLILQMCRLLRGFSHPTSYFSAASEGDSTLTLHSITTFSQEINLLQEMAIRTALIEKISSSLQSCLGGAGPMEARDHMAVHAVNQFAVNLYLFGSASNAMYRQHLLSDTGLVTTLLLPYINTCVRDIQCDDALSSSCPLLQGLCSSLRTLIIATFRAPPNKHVLMLLRRSNPSASLLRVPSFMAQHGALLALLLLLNINLGALDLVVAPERDNSALDAFQAGGLKQELAHCYRKLSREAQRRVLRSVMHAGSLPVSRDTPSFRAVMGIITLNEGGEGGCPRMQQKQKQSQHQQAPSLSEEGEEDEEEEQCDHEHQYHQQHQEEEDEEEEALGAPLGVGGWDEDIREARAEAKEEARHRLLMVAAARQQDKTEEGEEEEEEGEDGMRNSSSKRCEATCSRSSNSGSDGGGMRKYRLLGQLPPLGRGQRCQEGEGVPEESEVEEDDEEGGRSSKLQLPSSSSDRYLPPPSSSTGGTTTVSHGKGGGGCDEAAAAAPKELTCAINGHLMSDPVRSPHGHTYERSTIELWLRTRGQVCPLTGQPLSQEDLRTDTDLRCKIQRWHIERIGNVAHHVAAASMLEGEEIYEF